MVRKIIIIVIVLLIIATIVASLIVIFKINSDLEDIGGVTVGGNTGESTEPDDNTGSGGNAGQEDPVVSTCKKVYLFENKCLYDWDYCSGPMPEIGVVYYASVGGKEIGGKLCTSQRSFYIDGLGYSYDGAIDQWNGDLVPGWIASFSEEYMTNGYFIVSVWYYVNE